MFSPAETGNVSENCQNDNYQLTDTNLLFDALTLLVR